MHCFDIQFISKELDGERDDFDRHYLRTFFLQKNRDNLVHYMGMGTIF